MSSILIRNGKALEKKLYLCKILKSHFLRREKNITQHMSKSVKLTNLSYRQRTGIFLKIPIILKVTLF